jgi:6-phosphogluconolactonase (cycloisomerase 2 family)
MNTQRKFILRAGLIVPTLLLSACLKPADGVNTALAAMGLLGGGGGNGGAGAKTWVPKFAYVANYSEGTISAYTIDATTGALTQLTCSASLDPYCFDNTVTYKNWITGWNAPSGIAIDPTGRFSYVSSQNSVGGLGKVYLHNIDAATSAPSKNPAIYPAGSGPRSVAMHPGGKYLYAGITGSAISAFSIDATGALTRIVCVNGGGVACGGTSTSDFASGSFPGSIAITPDGRFLYSANYASNNVSAFAVNTTTGFLVAVGNYSTGGTGPVSISVDPVGRYVFVANIGTNDIAAYTINSPDGSLTQIDSDSDPLNGIQNTAAGSQPYSVAVHPGGRFVYVVNGAGFNTVSAFRLGGGGLLSPLTGTSTFATGINPYAIALDPSGRFAYVTNNGGNSVSAYTIDTGTGALSPLTGTSTFATGAGPQAITIWGYAK